MELSFTGLFSGAGGLDLGFEMAGYKHLYSSDIDTWSVRTLRDNRPNWEATEADIRELTARDLPDSWVFHGGNKRHTHKQIGNAVPVQFAFRIARFLKAVNTAQISGRPMKSFRRGTAEQIEMEL